MTQRRIVIAIAAFGLGILAMIVAGLSMSRQAERKHNDEFLAALHQCKGKPFYLCEPLNRADIEWVYYPVHLHDASTSKPGLELIYSQSWSRCIIRIEDGLIVEAGATVDWSRP